MNDSAHPRRVLHPAVDYEPPPLVLAAPAPRRPRRATPPRSAADPTAPSARPDLRAVAAFADTALRRVLEVLDRRRPAPHLQPVLATPLLDALRCRPATGPAARRHRASAVLRRVRVQAVGPENPPRAAEVVASYVRGPRTHAIACRVERIEARWQVVALQIG